MGIEKPEISVQVVNYKQKKDIEILLKQLNKFLKGLNYEVLIWDNSFELKESPNYRLFSSKKNIGFGSAHNLLSLNSLGDHLLILNPDVALKDEFFNYFNDFKNQDFGKGVLSLGKPDFLYSYPFFSRFLKNKRFSSYAFLISKTLYRTIGGFDINYFLYFEDDDLALRLNKYNIKTYFLKNALAHHNKNYSNLAFSLRKKYYYKSLVYFLKKNKRPLGYFYLPFIRFKLFFLR